MEPQGALPPLRARSATRCLRRRFGAGRQRAGAALLLCAALLLAACDAPPPPETLRFTSLGTEIEVRITEANGADQDAALTAARTAIETIHDAWHPTYGSELGVLNERLAAGESMTVSDDLIALLEQAAEVEAATQGRFSPAIGGLIELWGFSRADGPLAAPPPQDEIDDWVALAPRIADLTIDGNRISSTQRAVRIDLGAIGKGFAAQQAIAALREHGVTGGVVNLGGDLATLGLPEPGNDRHWRIGVRDPRSKSVIATVTAAADEAVFTSGDYERAFRHEERLYHHILDPTTGFPAMGSRSVTVVARDPTRADAAATALFIAGPEEWRALATTLGVEHVLLIDRDGTAWMSPAMAERVELLGDMESVRVE